MNLEIQKEVKDSVLFIKIIGLMDYSTVDSFKVEFPNNLNKIVVDFSGLDFIDSTGIGSILSIIHTASDRGVDVKFEGLNENTRELFDTVGVYRVMEALLRGGH
ncbi:STAS domain-containing protein [Paenibacillus agricola]|uniref:STAS domain-containing protein n=1 Tax=Paenibacillus agricola TaxID=2716264 RepID=A0ABX0JHV3_9BACL|nr:STAS domain-containing protein [Paenibacillus agricola]NHN35421.1 STAS domain-containing protein [Paenibacillus agricola]